MDTHAASHERQATDGIASTSNLVQRREHERHTADRRAAVRHEISGSFRDVAPGGGRVLEIGCGHGHFLTAYAAVHPDEACFGIDFSRVRVQRAVRKQEAAGAANLRFHWADAWDVLDAIPEHVQFSRVFVLFPDPWPKRRHRKNRLVTREFLVRLARMCVPAAEFCFRTDSNDYFEETRTLLKSDVSWAIASDRLWPFEHTTVFQQKAPVHRSLVAVNRDTATR